MRIAQAAASSLITIGFLTLVATGCTAAGADAWSILDRAGEASDAIPADLPAYAFQDADPHSARLVGEDEGTSFWLAKGGSDSRSVCLLAYRDAAAWVMSCAGRAGGAVTGSGIGSFAFVPDGSEAPADSTGEISENVFRVTAGG